MFELFELGFSRSVSRREYLLQTPDAFVRTPMPGLRGGMAVVHVAPRMGAGFAMGTAELEAGGVLEAGAGQRFLYVLEGKAELVWNGERRRLGVGGFAYLPEGEAHRLETAEGARVVVIEKPYEVLEGVARPGVVVGDEMEVASAALAGDEGLQVRCLAPADAGFDFAVNTMTYAPGAALAQVEVHYMEHGLLMLEGGGIYRLAGEWYPVRAGDAIWMAPFCPQWFAAVGKVSAKYLIYKDFNRRVTA